MKRKSSRNNKPGPNDDCQTPAYGVLPIVERVPKHWIIWEPAAGEGLMVDALRDLDFNVIPSTIENGQDFFEYELKEDWNCIVTNPPFSMKYDWIERCYALGKPWALLLPVETLGAATAQKLFDENNPHLLSFIFTNQRIDFKMPFNGWKGTAQFPVMWVTWGLRTDPYRQVEFYDLKPDKKAWKEANTHLFTERK